MSIQNSVSGLNTGYLRPERLPALDDAVTWSLQRCHTPASHAIIPPLLALLSEFNATVLPVEHEPGSTPDVDIRITISRPGEDHACRQRFVITSGGLGSASQLPESGSTEAFSCGDNVEPGTEGGDRPENTRESLPAIQVSATACEANPWRTAAHVVGEILRRIALNDQRTRGF